MRFSTVVVLIPVVLALVSCRHVTAPVSSPAFRYASGTSHGMCMGYCRNDMTLADTAVTMIWKDYGRGSSGRPDSVRVGAITTADLQALVAVTDWQMIASLDTIYGCPDCADQGAEYIEVTRGTITKRIMFDPRISVPQIQPLIDKLRAIRARFGA